MSGPILASEVGRKLIADFFVQLAEAIEDDIMPKFSGKEEMVMDFTFNRLNKDKNIRIIIRPDTKKVEVYSMREP